MEETFSRRAMPRRRELSSTHAALCWISRRVKPAISLDIEDHRGGGVETGFHPYGPVLGGVPQAIWRASVPDIAATQNCSRVAIALRQKAPVREGRQVQSEYLDIALEAVAADIEDMNLVVAFRVDGRRLGLGL
jgi:hypothetical protein